VETVVVDHDPAAIGFEFASKRAVFSTEDEPAVERLARAERVDGLISPGGDWPVGVAARVADRLGLPHPIDPATAAAATSKPRQRAALAAAGVPQPVSRQLSRYEEGLPVPSVVKAADRQGQRGLTLVRTREELPVAVDEALAASRNGSALLEELVDGPELTVNAVSIDGEFHVLTVTDRLTAEPPAFGVALAHAWPSEHDVSPVVEAARSAVEALGIRSGPSYTQVRLGADGPKVVEVAARLGGGHDAELCRMALGIDLNRVALELALGEAVSVEAPVARAGGACVVFLVAPEGELVETHGVEGARAVDGVLDVLVYRRPGHVFGPLRRGADRAGAVLAVGGSRDDALAQAGRAADAIRFEVALA
jgi:biotin carboxylase